MINRTFISGLFFVFAFTAAAQVPTSIQTDTSWKNLYRASAPRINDLVHTKLEVKFDIPNSRMHGKAWITLQPHFYPTDSLTLDTKAMDLREVSLISGSGKTKLQYEYDSLQVRIRLGKTFKKGEKYTVFVDYVARPEEVRAKGSAAIAGAKGLYFVNPKGDGRWPTQIWTQGEPESNSVWMPTIDKPNQKTTQELSMTVPDSFVTLSNGVLTSQKKNNDGTRTDVWKLDLPHAPYLFFMGAGPFAVVKDQYQKIPVNYYVEKQYEPLAKKIFGETPRMIEYFSRILKMPYPWPNYDQMVGREYVSGAMENTTATLHQDGAYQNARQLVDENSWESTIAHELFHHWFGNLVTTESWSNLALNESFANYSQYLWDEYRHGREHADANAYEEMQQYLMSQSSHKDLVRFYYRDKEDMFDAVSYNKGGRILHMLRYITGDDAFFTALNLYLTKYKFQTAEAHQLRLAFEEVTGMDMNWFWNQWFFGAGEPDLDISYDYANDRQMVVISQHQEKLFQHPLLIDIYHSESKKDRHQIWVSHASDTFYFAAAKKPLLVNVDAEKTLLATKNDRKDLDAFRQQYRLGPLYLDRFEALGFFAQNSPADIVPVLGDRYAGLRRMAIKYLGDSPLKTDAGVVKKIAMIASTDSDRLTRGAALEFLASLRDESFKPLFQKSLNDSSYSVAAGALIGLAVLNPETAYQLAKQQSTDAKGKLADVVIEIFSFAAPESDFDLLYNLYEESPFSESKVVNTLRFGKYLERLKNEDYVKKGVNAIMNFRNSLPEEYYQHIDPLLRQIFVEIATQQIRNGNNEVADYIRNLLPD